MLNSRRIRSQAASISLASSASAGATHVWLASITPRVTPGISIVIFIARLAALDGASDVGLGQFTRRCTAFIRMLPHRRVCYYAGFRAAREPPQSALAIEMPETNPRNADEKFQKGVEQFNHGHFFEAHETWEEIWLPAPEPERTFLQGIIQLAAAFHHYMRSNRCGAESLLAAGLKKLDRFPEKHRGLELEALRAAARRWIAALAAGHDPGREQLPRIRPSLGH